MKEGFLRFDLLNHGTPLVCDDHSTSISTFGVWRVRAGV